MLGGEPDAARFPVGYRIAKTPNLTAPHNAATWNRLSSKLGDSSAEFDDLVRWCESHDHPGGGAGFVRYCIKNGWLVKSNASSDPIPARSDRSLVERSATLRSARRHRIGVYLAYPTSSQLKRIDRNLQTRVNHSHTKVGKTSSSFQVRRAYYEKVFGGEVRFEPLAEVPPERMAEVEREVLHRLSLRYSRVGHAREWFSTDDREAIASIVRDAVAEVLARYSRTRTG